MAIPSHLDSLDRRVLRQLKGNHDDAIETARQAAQHGADSGFGGFTYTAECVAFYKRNRSAILDALKEDAEGCGTTTSALLASFKCLKGIDDPMSALVNPRHEDYDTVANALAWYALERCGQHLENP